MKKYYSPAFLSSCVCPGLGQMVKGEVIKGAVILVSMVLFYFLAIGLALRSSFQSGIVLTAFVGGIYAWNVYDAFAHVPNPKSIPLKK